MNYTKNTKQPQKLEDRFSPEFAEFVDDAYSFLSKYSGRKLASSIGVSRQALDDRKQRRASK